MNCNQAILKKPGLMCLVIPQDIYTICTISAPASQPRQGLNGLSSGGGGGVVLVVSSYVTSIRTTPTTIKRENGLTNKLHHFILRLSFSIAG